jgi:NTE family protein
MSAMSSWNSRQIRVFRRYCSLHGLALTPEVVAALAARYAGKHADRRPAAAEPVTLVLGGGGARGLAHVGVWRAVQERGVRTGRVVGSSVGALIGACIAGGMSWRELVAKAQRLARGGIFSLDHRILYRGTRTPSLLREEPLRELIRALLPVERFDQLAIPLSVNAVELSSGEVVWFGEGGRGDVPLAEAVYASCALPFFFPPAAIGGEHYVDGGIADPLPIPRAQALGRGRVVAVDLAADSAPGPSRMGMLETYSRVFELLRAARRAAEGAHPAPGVVRINPVLAGRNTFDISRAGELIEAGYRASLAGLAGLAAAPQPSPEPTPAPRRGEGRWLPSWLPALSVPLGRAALSR